MGTPLELIPSEEIPDTFRTTPSIGPPDGIVASALRIGAELRAGLLQS